MAPCSLSTGRMRTLTGRFLHDQFAGSHERFFIGQGNIHSPVNGPQSRFNTGSSHEGREDDVCLTFIDELQQALASGKDAARRADSVSHFFGGPFLDHTGQVEVMAFYLSGHVLKVSVSRHADQFKYLRMCFDNIDSLGPDGTGTARIKIFSYRPFF